MSNSILNIDILRCFGAPFDKFHLARSQLFSESDAERNADQVGIFEFDAGPLVAIVEQRIYIDSGSSDVVRRLLAGLRRRY